MRLSVWLPLRGGVRMGLQCVGRCAAEGVIKGFQGMEVEALESLWNADMFCGLLCELELLLVMVGLAQTGNVPQRGASDVLCKGAETLQRLVALSRHMSFTHMSPLCFLLSGRRPVDSSDIGDDITDTVCNLPSGSLLWFKGHMVISNCFNSLNHVGRSLDGPWMLRHEGRGRTGLEQFGQPSICEMLDEYHRFHGRVFLPQVTAEWRYVINMLASTAELLSLSPSGEDPIERVLLPESLAAVARTAVAASDSKEAVLLRWSVGGFEPVPMRVAVFDASAAECGSGPSLLVDAVPFTSHAHLATPPSSAGIVIHPSER